MAAFHVGQRVQTADGDGFRGTVRYLGSVAGQKGEWVGVEWDDVSRGKHDGNTGGHKYFECHVAGSGTFVRNHKIQGGPTLLEALKIQYQADGGQGQGTDSHVIMSSYG